ncbi:MAG: tetratricopeptide repeat protein [Kiritimatiellia bacterium]
MKRLHWLMLAMLVGGGFGMALYLVPGADEMAYCHLKNRDFAQARRMYEDLLARQGSTGTALLPLVELSLQTGDLDQAEKVARMVVREHPGDTDMLRSLGRILHFRRQLPEYLGNLEVICALDPTEQELLDLVRGLHFLQEYDREILARRKLIATAPMRPGYYDDLARLLAARGRLVEASETLRALLAAVPAAFSENRALLLESLLLDAGGQDGALVFARQRAEEGAHPLEMVRSASLFISKGRLDFAVRLMSPVLERALRESNPTLIGHIPEWSLIELADAACAANHFDFARLIFSSLSWKYATAAGVAAPPPDPVVQGPAAAANWPCPAQASLATYFIRNGDFASAHPLLMNIARNPETPDWVLDDLVYTSLETKRTLPALTLFETLLRDRPSPKVQSGWARLAAREGREADVTQWMIRQPPAAIAEDVLRDLIDLASAHAQTNLLLEATARLLARHDGNPERRLRIRSLLLAGRVEEARKQSQRLVLDSMESETLQLEVLLAGIRFGTVERGELETFAKPRLAAPHLDANWRAELVEALTESASYDLALPELRKLAGDNAANWEDLYLETLRKSGHLEELRQRWAEIAARPESDEQRRRGIAYELLALSDKSGAENLFKSLAMKNGPASADAHDLLFLWGPRPDEDQLHWLEGRARQSARMEDRAGWLRHLSELGGEQRVVDWVTTKMPASDRTPEILGVFVDALVGLGDAGGLAAFLDAASPETADIAELRHYATAARDLDLPVWEEHLLRRVLDALPDDPDSLLQLGALADRRRDDEEASRLLRKYIALQGDQALACTLLGEVARRTGRETEAGDYFHRAERKLVHASNPPWRTRFFRRGVLRG